MLIQAKLTYQMLFFNEAELLKVHFEKANLTGVNDNDLEQDNS